MCLLRFRHKGQKYTMDTASQVLKNNSTGETTEIDRLRDFGLIAAAEKCISDAERSRFYGVIFRQMVATLENIEEG